jgi:hypothetical protein
MKVNELIQNFDIQTSNEEKEILNKLKEVRPLSIFNERDQEVIRNLINKSLVRKIQKETHVMVVANGRN